MFLPSQAKNQPHFQVSERTYGNFIEICKDKKSAVFLANSGKFEKLISIQTCFYSTLYYSFTFLNKKYPFRQFSAYAPYKTRFSPQCNCIIQLYLIKTITKQKPFTRHKKQFLLFFVNFYPTMIFSHLRSVVNTSHHILQNQTLCFNSFKLFI